MITRTEVATSLFVGIQDVNTGKLIKIAIPSGLQVGLVDNPAPLDLFGRISVSTTDYTTDDANKGDIHVGNHDTIIAISNVLTPLTGRITIHLPANPTNGQLHFIKDASGTAATIPIDIEPPTGVLIDQYTNRTIDYEFGSMAVFWFRDKWQVLVAGVGEAGVGPSVPTDPTELTASFILATSEPGIPTSRTFSTSSNITFVDQGPGQNFYTDLTNTGVVSGTYVNATVTVDSKGRIQTINSGTVNVTRLTRTLYVDPGHPTTSPDGSIVNPFKILDDAQDIILAAAINTSWTVILQTGYDYTLKFNGAGRADMPTDKSVTYTSWNHQRTINQPFDTTISAVSSSYLYFLPMSLTSSYDITFNNLAVASTRHWGNGIIRFHNCYVQPSQRYFANSFNTTPNACTIYAYNTTLLLLDWSGTVDDGHYAKLEMYNSRIQGNIIAHTLDAVGCEFVANNVTLEATVALNLRSCKFEAFGGDIRRNGTYGGTNLKFYLDESTKISADRSSVTLPEVGTTLTYHAGSITRYDFPAEQMMLTNNTSWAHTASAEIIPVPGRDYVKVAAFSSSHRQGFGIAFDVPSGKSIATLDFWYMTPTSSVGGGFAIAMANSFMAYTSSLLTSWSTFKAIDVLPLETADRWTRRRIRLPFATLGFSDRSYQYLQFIRNTDHASDTNTSTLFIRNIGIELT